MATIDERVVAMKFDNTQFKAKSQETIADLQKLESTIDSGATKNLGSALGSTFSNALRVVDSSTGGILSSLGLIQKSASDVDMSGLSKGVEDATSKFSMLENIAVGALHNIGAKLADSGLNVAKAFTIQGAMDGFKEYELQINSVQTILANTQSKGSTLADVNKTLDDLNAYADRTIYNFGEMTKNIGTFTAAGVGLEDSAKAIKGIANLAALSGANSEKASSAMYQLSQAIAADKVGLEDWNSVVHSDMGGEIFQKALFDTAKAMGTLKNAGNMTFEEWTKNYKPFRETLADGWLTGKVLTKTLEKFTGDLSDEQLREQGYTEEQIASIQKLAQTANGAAQDVKTFTQMIGTINESIGSGWAQSWRIIIGDFEEAKVLWTRVSKVISGAVDSSAKSRNELLQGWSNAGGRTIVIDSLVRVFDSLSSVVAQVQRAFRQIFPPMTVEQVMKLTRGFEDLTHKLQPSIETVVNIGRTFKGFFALLHIGWSLIKAVGSMIAKVFGASGGAAGGLLSMTASLGDFLVKLDTSIQNGKLFETVFGKAGTFIAGVLEWISKAFGDVNGAWAKTLDFIHKVGRGIGKIFNILTSGKYKDGTFLGLKSDAGFIKFLIKVHDLVTSFIDKIKSFSILDWFNVSAGVGGAGILVLFAKIVSHLKAIAALKDKIPFLGGGNAKDTLMKLWSVFRGGGGDDDKGDKGPGIIDQLTESFGKMQQALKARALFQIAAAILALAAAVLILSSIDGGKLAQATAAVGALMAELMLALGGMTFLTKGAGFVKLAGIAGAIVAISAAILILAGVMKLLSKMSWEEIGKGLAAIGGAFLIIAAGTKLMPAKLLLGTAFALVPLANAIAILVHSIGDVSKLSWEEIGKGLATMAGVMLLMAGTLKLIPTKTAFLLGLTLNAFASSMIVLASALKSFGEMQWDAIGRGLAAMAGGLLIMVGAFRLMPATGGLAAVGILIMAQALVVMAQAFDSFGKMSIESIAHSLVAVAVGLLLMVGAVKLMPDTGVFAAVGILVMANALVIMGQALTAIGGLSIRQIVKGLIGLGGAMVILVAAANLMNGALAGAAAMVIVAAAITLMVPPLVTLSKLTAGQILTALLGLAGAFLVLGGAAALMTPLLPSLLGLAGAIALLGLGTLAAGTGLVALAAGLGALAALGKNGLDGLINILLFIPKVFGAIALGLVDFFGTLAEHAGKLGASLTIMFTTMIGALLDSGKTLMPKLIDFLVTLVVSMLDGLDRTAPKWIATFTHLMLVGLDAIRVLTPAIVQTGIDVFMAFVDGINDLIPRMAESGQNAILRLLEGVNEFLPRAIEMGVVIILNFLDGIEQAQYLITNKMFDTAVNMINNLADAIRRNKKALKEAGHNLASALLDGMFDGISENAQKVLDSVSSLGRKMRHAAAAVLGIHSPSRVFRELGMYTMQGLANGIDANSGKPIESSQGVAESLITIAQKVLGIHSPSRVFHGVGTNINQGLAQGIDESAQAPQQSLGNNLDRMIAITNDKGAQIAAAGGSFIDTLYASLSETDFSQRMGGIFFEAQRKRDEAIAAKREKYEEEAEKLQEEIESAQDAAEKAREDAANAQEDAAKVAADAKKDETAKRRAQQKADRAKKNIAKADKKYQKALEKASKLEAERAGFEAGEAYGEGMADGIENNKDRIKTLVEYIMDELTAEQQKLKTKVDNVVNVFDGISKIRSSVTSITDAAKDFVRAFNRMRNASSDRSFKRNLGFMLDSVIQMGQGVGGIIDTFSKFSPMLKILLTNFESTLPAIAAMVQPFAPMLAQALGRGLASAAAAITGPTGLIIAGLGALFVFLKDQAGNRKIMKTFMSLWTGLIDFLKTLPSRLTGFVKTMLKGLIQTIKDLPELIGTLVNSLIELFVVLLGELPKSGGDIIAALVKALIWIVLNSPRLFVDLATAIVEALANGLSRAFVALIDFLVNPFKWLHDRAKSTSDMDDVGAHILQTLWQSLVRLGAAMLQLLLSPFRALKRLIFGELDLSEAGGNMVQGLVNGIRNRIYNAVESARGLGSMVANGFKRVLGINSPSTVFQEFGYFLVKGLADGMDDQETIQGGVDTMKDALMRAMDEIEDNFNSDISPTITPVVNLDQAKRDMDALNRSIPINNTYSEAAKASTEVDTAADAKAAGDTNITNIEYVQNNTSPQALSTYEIYRNTRKQLEDLKKRNP